MGDAVTVYNLRQDMKLYRKWARLDQDARRFVLRKLLDQEITEKLYKSAVKEWRKEQREKAIESGG